jgi:NAD(P)-dependent dehydrogenase (short-subunit alcohol dehydrogenase family)
VARAALVTGGSSGIGLAIATMLRAEGFELTLAARTKAKVEAAATELGAHAVTADVAREEDCRRMVDEHRGRHGRLDVLVNSAGVGVAGPIDELETKKIDLQLDVNLRGTMLVTAAALPLLRERSGLVVNIASIAGTGPSPGLPVYGAAKAAVIQFTNTLNRAEEQHGVRATALSPGFVDTPMTDWAPVPPEQIRKTAARRDRACRRRRAWRVTRLGNAWASRAGARERCRAPHGAREAHARRALRRGARRESGAGSFPDGRRAGRRLPAR